MKKRLLLRGDCLKRLKELPDNSVDSLVTDPPAGIAFMGKDWDDFRRAHNKADVGRKNVFGRTSRTGPEYARGSRDNFIEWLSEVMQECLRVLKPGAHGLVWAIPRTAHWTATALEDAGFEVRDCITHLFGTGFPKSLDVSRAIDKELGEKRPIIGKNPAYREKQLEHATEWKTAMRPKFKTGSASDAAKQWDGWGSALKPSAEFWWLVRKPLSEKTLAKNVLKHGCGGLHIDACRIETTDKLGGGATKAATIHAKPDGWDRPWMHSKEGKEHHAAIVRDHVAKAEELGRFPANVILDEDAAKMLDAQTGMLKSGVLAPHHKRGENVHAYGKSNGANPSKYFGGDIGGASRFFYVAKASSSERSAGLEGLNEHPTIKPVALMEYLCTLITPPEGIVLDPFMGSGTTGIAAKNLKLRFIGIEKSKKYFKIAKQRIKNAKREKPEKKDPTLAAATSKMKPLFGKKMP